MSRKLLYPALALIEGIFPTAPTPHGWEWQQSPEILAKSFPVIEQQFPAFQPEGRVISTMPQGWLLCEPPIKLKPPLAEAQQWFPGAFQTPGPIFSITKQGFWPEPPGKGANGFAASQQQFACFQPEGSVALPPNGWPSGVNVEATTTSLWPV